MQRNHFVAAVKHAYAQCSWQVIDVRFAGGLADLIACLPDKKLHFITVYEGKVDEEFTVENQDDLVLNAETNKGLAVAAIVYRDPAIRVVLKKVEDGSYIIMSSNVRVMNVRL